MRNPWNVALPLDAAIVLTILAAYGSGSTLAMNVVMAFLWGFTGVTFVLSAWVLIFSPRKARLERLIYTNRFWVYHHTSDLAISVLMIAIGQPEYAILHLIVSLLSFFLIQRARNEYFTHSGTAIQ